MYVIIYAFHAFRWTSFHIHCQEEGFVVGVYCTRNWGEHGYSSRICYMHKLETEDQDLWTCCCTISSTYTSSLLGFLTSLFEFVLNVMQSDKP
jgi:hypothetical protein